MKKGCFVALVTWAAAAGAYWYYIHTRFVPPLDWVVPVVAGLMAAIIVGNLRAAADSAISAMRASQQETFSGMMGERPKDGQVLTVVGHIRVSGGSTLEAPITGRPAILYSYDIDHQARMNDGIKNSKDFAGFGLTPSVIDSRLGPIRLLGFPNLEGFAKESIDAPDLSRVNAYIAATPFQDMTGFNPVAIYREIKELMTDDDGQLRKDWRMTTGEITEDHDCSEQIVAPGEQVTAIGRYSADKQGLVPTLSGGSPLRLIRGDAQMSSSALWKQAAGRVIGAIIFAAIVNGALFGFLQLHPKPIAMPKSDLQRGRDIDQMHAAARDAEIPVMADLVAKGVDVDARDAEMETPLMRAGDGKTAEWLIAHGANVNAVDFEGKTALMEAARRGDTEVVKALIQAKANLDTLSTKWKTTALQQALDAEKLDTAQLLRDGGAHDVTVTEKNGTAVGKNSEAVRTALKYLDAIQHQDAAAIHSLSTRDFDKDVDWKAVKESRPIDPILVNGFANEEAATLALRGKRSDGTYSTWTLQLDHMSVGWKVSDERWETRFDSKNP